MKATDLLRNQHREIEELFQRVEGAEDEQEREEARRDLANHLAAHTAVEEELVYPAGMAALGPSSLLRESFEEHAALDFMVYRLMRIRPVDPSFGAKVSVIKDLFMNHMEKEESELFIHMEDRLGTEKLEELGQRLEARFEDRLTEGPEALLQKSLGIAAPPAQVAVQVPAAARPRAVAKKAARRAPEKKAAAAARGGAKKAAPQRATAKKAPAPKKGRVSTTTRGKKAATSRGPAKRKSARSPSQMN